MTKKKQAGSRKPASNKPASNEVNKSAAIRDILLKTPQGKPQAIAKSLADQGVHVSAAFVSQVKLKMKNRDEAVVVGRVSSPSGGAGQFDGSDLLDAKRLIDKLGVEKARAAVELVAKLS